MKKGLKGINPFNHGAAYTDIMKTQALKQALNKYGFTAAFGGGRRDEGSQEPRKEFSFRNKAQAWDPKNQRPRWEATTQKSIRAKAFVCSLISN